MALASRSGTPLILALVCLGVTAPAAAQVSSAPSEGVRDNAPRHVALVNARIVVEPGKVIERGSVVLRDGRIAEVVAGERVPAGAERRDLAGRTVFAGFIEPLSVVGVPPAWRQGAEPETDAPAEPGPRHWNERVRPERDITRHLQIDAEELEALRGLGFTAAHAVPERGIFRGQSALISLRAQASDRERVLDAQRAQQIAFETGDAFGGDYPGSLMGSLALIRQSLLDARWQADSHAAASRGEIERAESNPGLDALLPLLQGKQSAWYRLQDELDPPRAIGLSREFGHPAVLLGSGSEYRILPRLRDAGLPLVLPLDFPEPPPADDPLATWQLSLAELQHWEQAPANPGRLAGAGLAVALTSHGLKDSKDFWPNLRRAVAAGLDEQAALAALTTQPAQLLGQASRLGRVAAGQWAYLTVADGTLFHDESAVIHEVWIDGRRHEIAPLSVGKPVGSWALRWSDGRGPALLQIEGEGELQVTTDRGAGSARLEGSVLVIAAPRRWFGDGEGREVVRLRLQADRLDGFRVDEAGRSVAVSGERSGAPGDEQQASARDTPAIPPFKGYPAGEYARLQPPEQPEHLLLRNATIWTQGPQGRLEGADMLVRRGRILRVGTGLSAPRGAVEIDASGLHLTPGIIDAHSHTAIAGNVNEPSHAVTSEVRIEDVLDPTDISIYRQLAGGVTTALLLHGSANPMGGQSATVKWRWGEQAEGLRFVGAPPGIKFALGENVKQSNWGEAFVVRYPQSRMGVEQLMRDQFNAARVYQREQAAWARNKRGVAPRRDLRLEALAQILAGERRVHIHSYRQDEILMFARLSQDYGFPVATFQHVLEGYKVADVIAAIGAGASTFSDWWAFKMEVYDGIPHNAAMLVKQGVLSSINSDSDEVARRLNAEAGKAVKYGGLDETAALDLVTRNPALQLGVADRVGSLEPGKDADFVLWRGNPLSSMARVEQTWIEGRAYFSREDDRRRQASVQAERERLLALALEERLKAAREDAADESTAAKSPATPPPAGWHPLQGRSMQGLALRQAARRGLYHSGAHIKGCTVAEHHH